MSWFKSIHDWLATNTGFGVPGWVAVLSGVGGLIYWLCRRSRQVTSKTGSPIFIAFNYFENVQLQYGASEGTQRQQSWTVTAETDLTQEKPLVKGKAEVGPVPSIAYVTNFFVPFIRNSLLEHEDPWITKIKAKLAGGGKAVVSGGGGIGKTAMALEYAYRFSSDYPGGVFWLMADLGLGQAIWELAGRMAVQGTDLGLKPGQSDDDYVLVLASFLSQREKSLVVLDKVEDPDILRRLVLSKSDVLATSRRSGLPLPPVNMDLPEPDDALDIFLSYAGGPKTDRSPDELAAAAKICERVDNLPLALEIMGLTSRDTALVDLAVSIDDVISTEAITQAKGETSVVRALKLAEQKYSHPRSKEALIYLGYFHPQEIEVDLVAEVMEVDKKEVSEALRELARFSVIKPRPEGGYATHRLIQEAAQEMDDQQAAGQRVADYLDAPIQAVLESGEYQKAYPLIPHLVHLAELATEETFEAVFPTVPLASRWAVYLWQSGHYALAEQMFQTCLTRVKKSKGDEDPDYAILLNNLALMLHEQGKYEEAEGLFRQALEIDERTIGREHPDYAIHLNNQALVLGAQGQYQEAERLFRQALKIGERTIGREHPEYATHLNNLAGVLKAQGMYREAKELLRQTLEIGERTLGKEHPYYARGLNNLAGVLEDQGEYQEAESFYRQALEIDERTIGKEHPEYAIHLNNQAWVLKAQGEYKEAERLLRQALEIDEKTVGREHPQTANHLRNLGRLLADQGRLSEAEPLLAEALDIFTKFLGPDHPDTQSTQAALDRIRSQLK